MEHAVKEGPPLTISALLLYQMLSDPGFFSAVPVFMFLRPQAEAIVDKLRGDARDRRCAGCGDLNQALRPLLLQFATVAADLAQASPGALDPLREYVAQRRGFRPASLVVYTQRGRLEF